MDQLTKPMQQLMLDFNAGSVATVNDDGTPAVSPKATFVVVNASCIAYGNIRSPATSANLRKRPAVEVNFIDVLSRTALRVRGKAYVVAKDSAQGLQLTHLFRQYWEDYLLQIQEFVNIEIEHTEMVISPAYDVGLTREALIASNLQKLQTIK